MNRRVIAIACLLLLVGGADALRAGTCPDVCGIPQTGQTTCRDDVGFFVGCADTGQDGDYQAGTSISPRFTDNGDGTVTDELTKLIWLQDADCFGERTWDSALSDANTLASGACGLTDGSVAGDWRLPNVREMHSLIDYDNVNPALPTGHPFVGYDTTLNEHWTSTTRIADPEAAFTVRVKLGGIKSVESKTATIFHVWPVRGGLDDCSGGGVCGLPKTGQIDCWDSAGTSIPCAGTGQDGEWQAGLDWPDPRFTDNGDGTVTDNFTDLVWLQQEDCDILPWLDGLTLANNLADGTCGLTDGSSAGDWRVPNVREMLSLADYSQTNPSIPAGPPLPRARIPRVEQLQLHQPGRQLRLGRVADPRRDHERAKDRKWVRLLRRPRAGSASRWRRSRTSGSASRARPIWKFHGTLSTVPTRGTSSAAP